MNKVTLILTAYKRDYCNYLSMVLNVNPHCNKDYKMCTEVEHIRGISRDSIKEVILLKGRPINNKADEERIWKLIDAVNLRFKVKEITY